MKKIIAAILLINTVLIGYTVYHKHNTTKQAQASNVDNDEINQLLLSEPIQENLKNNDLKQFKVQQFSITPVKRYKIAARVLRKENYSFGQSHEVLPVDLVLGWNIMADIKTVEDNKIAIHQSNRFYFWHIDSFEKISREQIEHNSANVHIMPYNEKIKDTIDDLSKNDIIYLEGYLVNIIDENNNYRFISSLSREDTGAGACEVFLVTEVKKYE